MSDNRSTATTMTTSTNDEMPAAFRWIFCIGFMFIGLVFFVLGGYQLLQGLKTKDWPAAPGKILSSKVQSGIRNSHGPVRTTGTSGRRYSVDVRYRYEVDGQEFEGSRLRYGSVSYKSRSKAQKVKNRYPPGKELEVFYDQRNPQSSVLVKGIGLSWLAIGLGAIAFILGLVVFIKTVIGARRNSGCAVGDQL